jgi:hypothetical protein
MATFIVVCELERFSDCCGSHHRTDANVVQIILVFNYEVVGGKHNDAAGFSLSHLTRQEPHSFEREGMWPCQTLSNLEQ